MRLVSAALATVYAISALAVCLGACLSMPADHGCCADETSLRTAARDCCAVAPAERSKAVAAIDATPVAPAVAARLDLGGAAPLPAAFSSVAPAASPPRVLRI